MGWGPNVCVSNELPREAVAAATRAGELLHSLLIGPAWDRGPGLFLTKASRDFSHAQEKVEKELGTWRVLSPVHTDIQFQDRVPLVFRVHSFLCSQLKKKRKVTVGCRDGSAGKTACHQT